MVNEPEEKNLLDIEYWTKQKVMTLLIPEKLSAEWERNKNRSLNEIRQGLNVGLKGFRRKTQTQVKQEIKRMELKAQRIDAILAAGRLCKETKQVHAEVGVRRNKKLAPYHLSQENDGDAYLYFTTTRFCKIKDIKELIFISHDKHAFSQPDKETILHTGLEMDEINIIYHYGIGPGSNYLRQNLGTNSLKKEDDIDFESIYYPFENKETIPLSEKIYQSLHAYYDQLPFIPLDLLVKMYPFKVADSGTNFTYYSSFRINTNSNALAEFFQSIEINKNDRIQFVNPELVKNVKRIKQKIQQVLLQLNQNLVFHISAIKSSVEADIRLSGKNEKETIQDKFNHLHFLVAYQALISKPQNDLRKTVEHAYLYFQFGDFDTAIQLFDSVYESALTKGKVLLSFIALYNMKRLKTFLNAYYTSNDPHTMQIIKKINKLPIRKYATVYDEEPPFVQDCIAWIGNTDFYHDAFINLSQTVEKIRDHYHLQLKGGFSSNSNYQNLVSQYLIGDQFLELNCIIFNTYSNFEELTEKLAEGLFMMHGFSSKQNYRLESIDYYLLQKMILYSRRETLIKFYHRYSVTRIVKNDLDERKSLLKMAERLFGGYKKLRKVLVKTQEKNPFFFWEKYFKVVGNILVLITIVKSEEDLSDLLRKMMDVFKDDFISKRLEMDTVADFIREKGKYMEAAVLKDFLLMVIDNKRFHSYQMFHALEVQMRQNHKNIIIQSKAVFSKIERYFLHECPKCKTFHEPALAKEIYFLLDDLFKAQMKTNLLHRLSKKFNPELYYIFALSGIVDFELYFEEFVESCPPLKNTKSSNSFFGGNSEASYPRLNEVINLAYKCNVDIKERLYSRYKGISPYYEWLLDLEGFDYAQFDPEWILAYKTDIYFKRIFACEKVRKCLSDWFKKEKHPVLWELAAKYAINL